jgi:hypothetical protein
LIGLGALSALAIGVAAAQRPTTEGDQPAQLDRTFGPDLDGGVGGAGGRDPGMSTDLDGGAAMVFDGGAGSVSSGARDLDAGAATGGGAGGAGGSGAPSDFARGRDGGTGDGGVGGGSAQAGGHTNIIVYGPNGIPPEQRSAGR